MELIIESIPEVKITGNILSITYREEGLVKKNTFFKIENIILIKFRIHKTGIGFWLLVILNLLFNFLTQDDNSFFNYESKDELSIITKEDTFEFTFHKNLKKKDLKLLQSKFISLNINTEILSK